MSGLGDQNNIDTVGHGTGLFDDLCMHLFVVCMERLI